MENYTLKEYKDEAGNRTMEMQPNKHGVESPSSAPLQHYISSSSMQSPKISTTTGPQSSSTTSGSRTKKILSTPDRHFSFIVMGGTGVGKSSLIAQLTKFPVKIGHSLQSCTENCKGWTYIHNSSTTITVIDTPGFDDTVRPNIDILNSIVSYLQSHRPVMGIIYMHRITDKRMTGTTLMNLQILQALAGVQFLKNVVCVTSMWNTIPSSVPREEIERREAQLIASTEFWGSMIDAGARPERFLGERASALRIVDLLCERTAQQVPQLGILTELAEGCSLEDTSAGKILTAELRRKEEKRLRELREEEEEDKRELEEARMRARDEEKRSAKSSKVKTKKGRSESRSRPAETEGDFARVAALSSWFRFKPPH
ncbi:hypothetical protein BP6252_06822 [Coleophoma cylindrospora]|uniref:AIG1-type G domain-containing protein n=1 Tax=Coleophoma cylindrospora TaxID=1849047 RepID=A0A3D8RFU3_9HELO|nr:hypothetical protein BP6252_06822 [Coleophoma cylindrospora]